MLQGRTPEGVNIYRHINNDLFIAWVNRPILKALKNKLFYVLCYIYSSVLWRGNICYDSLTSGLGWKLVLVFL